MKKTYAYIFASTFLAVTAHAFTVSGVSAHQRWPWSSLVDVDFTIGGAAAESIFKIEVKASYAGGDRVLDAKTFVNEPVAKPGSGRVTWDIGADFPDFKATDLRVAVIATPFDTASTPVYMVVDLSGGKNATSYPVRYTTVDPIHTPKAKDACKTTELWLRRIHPDGARFIIAGTAAPTDSNSNYYVTMTKDYYIAIFETTQQQWYQLNAEWLGDMSNETWRATRPLDCFYTQRLFGSNPGWQWPDNKSIQATSVLGKLRSKTGIAFNLPTEAQWQFAANGGTVGDYTYRNPQGATYSYAEIMRYAGNANGGNVVTADGWDGMCDADSGSACVGSYKPNAYGLYDMIGNVSEDCVDAYASGAKTKQYYVDNGFTFPLVDPEGLSRTAANELNGSLRVVRRGGTWRDSGPTLVTRELGYQAYTADNHGKYPFTRGFRLSVTCE